MYTLIKECLYIANFNAGTPNYHHCLLSSNVLSVLKGREECSVISLHMHTYWIILVSTLNPTLKCSHTHINLNIKVCLIIMQITICMINCADYNLSDHYANIIQLSNSHPHA